MGKAMPTAATRKRKGAKVQSKGKVAARGKPSASKKGAVPVKKAASGSRRNQARGTKRKAPAASHAGESMQRAIIETSPASWSQGNIGPTFEQVQLAAYHRWLQNGGSDFDNWTQAENDLRGRGQA